MHEALFGHLTITSQAPKFLKICTPVNHVTENTFCFGSVA
jgi:hypothetical protein